MSRYFATPVNCHSACTDEGMDRRVSRFLGLREAPGYSVEESLFAAAEPPMRSRGGSSYSNQKGGFSGA